ncbi:MAG: hypothetical protein ACREV9_10000 [Burkholderiales bacterium]
MYCDENFMLAADRSPLMDFHGILGGAPQLIEALSEPRSQRLVFMHEVDAGAGERLRRDALDPGAQIGVVVVGAPQADVSALRSRHESDASVA